MTGDLSEPAHGAAQQAYEAAARLYEQAAAELNQAAAHCRVAATHFRGAEVPRGAARLGGAGHLREAELRLEEQARTHRLKARLSGLCRRSPAAGDRWHRPQPAPAARFTAVLPRGSGGDTGGARRHRQGDGDTAEGSGFGGPETSGGVAGNPGESGLAAGGAAQGRGRPPPATPRHLGPGPLRHGRSGPGLSRPGTRIGRPPRTSTRRAPCIRQGQARCARPFATHDGGAAVRSGSSRARPSCWLASRAVLGVLPIEVVDMR
jgi:hypothetical protein